MTYATLDQLKDRFGEKLLIKLTDRSQPASGAIDQAVIDRALADTDALIDGHLAERYALPLASVPALVTDTALAIAVYKLHRNTVSDKIKDDYGDALKLLRDLTAGKVRLDVAGSEPASVTSDGIKTNKDDRPMTSDNMSGFI